MAGENFNEAGDLRSIRESVAALAAGAPGSAGATEAKQDTQITAEQATLATLGATNGAAVVTDANGTVQQYLRGIIVKLIAQLPAALGRKSAALSLAVVPAGMSYEAVAASDTDEVLGTTGAAGDYLSHIVIQPATLTAGAVTVKDGATTIFSFLSGTLSDLRPIIVPFGIISAGALSITTGTNVTVLAAGNFT